MLPTWRGAVEKVRPSDVGRAQTAEQQVAGAGAGAGSAVGLASLPHGGSLFAHPKLLHAHVMLQRVWQRRLSWPDVWIAQSHRLRSLPRRRRRSVPTWLLLQQLLLLGIALGIAAVVAVQRKLLPPRLTAADSPALRQSFLKANADRERLLQQRDSLQQPLDKTNAEARQRDTATPSSRRLSMCGFAQPRSDRAPSARAHTRRGLD